MSSYLNSLDYIVWFAFIVTELVLFLRLTDVWLKPVRWFMIYAVIRDLALLTLTAKEFMYQYFIVYWFCQMISFIWFGYISGCIVKKLRPETPTIITLLPATCISLLCGLYIGNILDTAIDYTPKLFILQRECLGLSVATILIGVLLKSVQKIKGIIPVTLIMLVGLIMVWVWEHFGYQPLVWETSWTFALIGVVFALKQLLPVADPQ